MNIGQPKNPIETTESAENSIEAELSPEDIERIMEKVGDINAEGTAFTWLRATSALMSGEVMKGKEIVEKLDRLKSILKDGLLGVPRDQIWSDSMTTGEERKSLWVGNVREGKLGGVYFNIIGQSTTELGQDKIKAVKDTKHYRGNDIGLIFDLSKLKLQSKNWQSPRVPKKSREFWTYNSPGTLNVSFEEYGFVVAGRVPPRMFLGIIIETSQIRFEEVTSILMKILKDHPKDLLPVYDLDGNLLWPRHMSHEEVKKLEEERQKTDD